MILRKYCVKVKSHSGINSQESFTVMKIAFKYLSIFPCVVEIVLLDKPHSVITATAKSGAIKGRREISR